MGRGRDRVDEMRRLSRSGDYAAALVAAREAADIAEASGDRTLRRDIGGKLICLGDVGRGGRLLALPGWVWPASRWQGQPLAGRRLTVRQVRLRAMGITLSYARFVGKAVAEAARCVVVVEPRLRPLFERSFPGVEVWPMSRWWQLKLRPGDLATTFDGLVGAYASDWASLKDTFTPLLADGRRAAKLHAEYTDPSGRPLVGISWGSANAKKDLPPLEDWLSLLGHFDAKYVSLQYGKVDDDIALLSSGGRNQIVEDKSVDQLVDMDRLAAQIAALDVVVSISVTAAHLAGAMGKPLILILSDQVRSIYPVTGNDSGWYPNGDIVRRERRPWPVVMGEVRETLSAMLAARGTGLKPPAGLG